MDEPWHHKVYDDVAHWSTEKLQQTYLRLSRDLRIAGHRNKEHYDRMGAVESELRERGEDPDEIARQVQQERDESFLKDGT